MSAFQLLSNQCDSFLTSLLTISLSACVIAGAIVLVQTMFSRWLTPAGRQRLWLLLIIRLLLPVLPSSPMSVANISLARWLRHPNATSSAIIENPVEAGKFTTTVRILPSNAPATLIADAPALTQSRTVNALAILPLALVAIWFVVAAALTLRLVRINRDLHRRLSRGEVVTDPQTLDILQIAARDAGVRTLPALSISDVVSMPAVEGGLRPHIILPPGLLQTLTPAQLRHVLLHELSHIRHRDVLGNWVMAMLSIIHWFNPLIRIAVSRVKTDREMARDAWVIERTQASNYGQTLIDVARMLRINPPSLAAHLPGLFGRESSLKRRLKMICELSVSRRRSRAIGVVLMLILAGGLLTRAAAQTKPTEVHAADSIAKTPSPTTRPSRHVDPVHADTGMLSRDIPDAHFNGENFNDVVDFLRKAGGVNIFANWKVIEQAGIDRNAPVTCVLRHSRLRDALDEVLYAVGQGRPPLGYRVEGNVITISTVEDLKKDVIVRVYDVRDLLTEPKGVVATKNGPSREHLDTLADKIVASVDPSSWRVNHGSIGSIRVLGGQIIVTQNSDGHAGIEKYLNTLREQRLPVVTLQLQYFECDNAALDKELKTWWAPTALQPPTRAELSQGIMLQPGQFEQQLKKKSAADGFVALASPKASLLDTQRAEVQSVEHHSIITGYAVVTPLLQAADPQFEPTRGEVQPGIDLEVSAVVSNDIKSVSLSARCRLTTLLSIKKQPWIARPAGSNLMVDSPQTSTAESQVSATIPENQSLLIALPRPQDGKSVLMVITPTVTPPKASSM